MVKLLFERQFYYKYANKKLAFELTVFCCRAEAAHNRSVAARATANVIHHNRHPHLPPGPVFYPPHHHPPRHHTDIHVVHVSFLNVFFKPQLAGYFGCEAHGLVREVRGLILRQVKLAQCHRLLAKIKTFLRSCVATVFKT